MTAASKRPRKAKRERDTDVIYLRMPKDLAAQIRKRADELGWPHTYASVAVNAIKKDFP
jgi:hypothetical protein